MTDLSPRLTLIVDALAGKREGSQWRCLCPVHNGRSLIAGEKNGTVLVHCQGGCEQLTVIDALREQGLWSSPATAKKGATHALPQEGERLEDKYEYRGADGELVAVKARFRTFGGKTFRWALPGDDNWTGLHGIKEADLPLFGAHLLGESDGTVFVCEGEKAVKACQAAGLTAVCAAGGSGQRNFRQAFAVLRDREVVLWPDNDSDGGGLELMRRISDELQGVAKAVSFVRPDLLKLADMADAFDYFEDGGTVDALLETLAKVRTDPWVEPKLDGYLVSLPVGDGYIRFDFSDVGHGRQGLEARAATWREIPGESRATFTAHLNLLSISNRDAYARNLGNMFGKEDGAWTARLSLACELVSKAENERDDSIVLLDADVVEIMHLAAPFVLSEGPVCIFGAGGSAKTFLALALSAHISLGVPFLGRPVKSAAVLYVDYESSAGVLKQRMMRLLAGMEMQESLPPIFYWEPHGAPLHDLVRALQRKIRREGIGFVVVDSAILAAGGDPERAETAARYFNALKRLGVPSLTISHTTKKNDDSYPFGSIFWSNSFRSTWNLKLIHTDEGGKASLGAMHRKVNDDRPEKPMGLRLTFDGKSGPVTIAREDLDAEWEGERSQPERIREALRQGKRSVNELAEELDLPRAIVRTTLNQRMPDVEKFGMSPDRSRYWGLALAHG